LKTSEYPHYQCPFDEFNVAQESVVPFLDQDVNLVIAFNTAVGKCVRGDTRVCLSDGAIRTIDEIYNDKSNVGVLSVGPDLKISGEEFHKVRLVGKELLRFKVKTGLGISVTPEHPFLTLCNGIPTWVQARNVGCGDYIAVVSRIPEPAQSYKINMADLVEDLSHKRVYIKYDLRSVLVGSSGKVDRSRWARLLGVKKYQIGNWSRGKRFPLSYFHKLLKMGLVVPPDELELYSCSSTFGTKISTSISNDIAWLVGIIIGDGHVDKNSVKIHSSDDEILDRACCIFNKLGLHARIIRRPDRCSLVMACSCVFVGFLTYLGIPVGKKSDTVRVPEILMKQRNANVKHLLRGIFDSDGCGGKTIELGTNSERLAHDVQMLLKRFGVQSSVSTRYKRKHSYRVFVTGRDNIELFLRDVGFSLKRKADVTRDYFAQSNHTNSNKSLCIPATMLNSIRKNANLLNKHLSYSVRNAIYVKRKITKNVLREFLQQTISSRHLTEWRVLDAVVNGDVDFVPVTSKTRECPPNYVYDLCVPTKNTFVAEGIVVHNTALAECAIAYHLQMSDKKVAYVSPFKAISQQRYEEWSSSDQLRDYGVLINTGDNPVEPDDFHPPRILILTSESLDSKSRNAIHFTWIRQLACVVFDEAHIIGQKGRGDKVESSMIRLASMNPSVRFILLSATMSNAVELAKWVKSLNGKPTKCVQSSWRPTRLIFEYHGYEDRGDRKHVYQAKMELVKGVMRSCLSGDKVLVFVHSKRTGAEVIKTLRGMGITCAFHNASVRAKNRTKIEDAFNDPNSGLDVIVSTSTLASGVNL